MSKDLIDRQAAIDALFEILDRPNHAEFLYTDEIYKVLNALPPAQPERKKGKWRHYEGYLTCSECRTEYDDDIMTHCCDDVPNFCPNCGPDMRGEQDETD